MWCCLLGVILFILLSGSFPFHGTGEKIYDSIRKGIPTVSNLLLPWLLYSTVC